MSNQRPAYRPSYYRSAPPAPPPAKPHKFGRFLAVVVVLAVVIGGSVHAFGTSSDNKTSHESKAETSAAVPVTAPAPSNTPPAVSVNACASNSLSQLILVSISKRHLWACDGATVVYNSPVVTGMDFLAADLTPPGTYHIYAKESNLNLTGCDSTGCWNDHVSYWMPFLDNQYGVYGLHDATWRPANAFGMIPPSSDEGSHGCVELPLATAAWLYGWANVGTTVTIQS